ncbi:MAG: hypothetical protein WA814_09705 [Candidatus Baltobacteraceae bacterium]
MPNLRASILGVVAALSLPIAAATAPPAENFLPALPGTVVQAQVVFLQGDGNHARWKAVTSKKLIGSGNGRDFYQWWLSIYQMRGEAYRLRYQSPGSGGPLSKVTQASGAKMWFPVQDVKIVGQASMMRPGVQQLVVQSHEMAADCGSATVSVFASGPGSNAARAISVTNACELSATIVHGETGDTLQLTGPYYAANAPLCCPTKAHATAMLSHLSGKWTITPSYFKIK